MEPVLFAIFAKFERPLLPVIPQGSPDQFNTFLGMWTAERVRSSFPVSGVLKEGTPGSSFFTLATGHVKPGHRFFSATRKDDHWRRLPNTCITRLQRSSFTFNHFTMLAYLAATRRDPPQSIFVAGSRTTFSKGTQSPTFAILPLSSAFPRTSVFFPSPRLSQVYSI